MSKDAADSDTYALKSDALPDMAAPDVPYRPPMPRTYRPRIGMIGTGGISGTHLQAYRTAGWEVAAFWNRSREKAEAKAAEFYGGARIEDGWQSLLEADDIDIVDITLPTEIRAPVIEAALKSGKHVLSQKPFVTDLDTGERLVDLADERGLQLAVNQNGRWSPHMAWMRNACALGLIGEILSVHGAIHWNHGWTAGTPFDRIEDLILYDFGIHWFDFLSSLVGDRAESVFAGAAHARGQANEVPLMAQAQVRLEGGQASLIFDGGIPHGPRDTTYIGGRIGSLVSTGADLGRQTVTLTTEQGAARPVLEGTWFNDGFRGAMGDLLCAIEDGGEPSVSARRNLHSLALVFAAIQSRKTGREIRVGAVRSLDG